MTVETFFANFGYLADAPNGMQKLRELILQLAVQGKLVPQDPKDESASDLMERIEIEKKRLVKEGLAKKGKLPALIEEEQIPFSLPTSWSWFRLGELGITQTGTTPKKGDHVSLGRDYPFIKPANIYPSYVDYPEEGLSEKGIATYGRLAPKGSILMVCIGTIGKSNIIDRDCSFNQQINSISPYSPIDPYYLKHALRSSYFQAEAWGRSSSTTIAILNKGKWESIPVSLPPIEEQKRIVAKVDQLMILCDELEARQQKQQQGRMRLNNSALDAMLTAREPDEFANHWQRICDNFNLLYDHPETIAKLRAAILQLAIQGKLVPQDPNDEPASILLERIKAEKEKLVNGRKYQKTASQPDLKQVEKAIALPVGWVLSLIGGLCPSIVPNRDKPKKFTGNIPWVTLPNLDKNSISINFYGNDLGLTPEEIYIYSARVIPNSSVIMSCVGRFGLCAVTSCELVINQQLHAFVILDQLDAKFIAYSVKAHSDYLGSIATSTTIKYLNKTKCESIPIFLPPREEQKRIVAKVDQLMTLCNKLEAKLNQAQQHSKKLMTATVRQLLVA